MGRYCAVGNDFNNDGVRKKNILWFFEVVFCVVLYETALKVSVMDNDSGA